MPRQSTTKDKSNRDKRLPVVQVTAIELSTYVAKGRRLKYKTFSDFVRDTLANAGGGGDKKATDHDMIKAFLEVGKELNASGNNLNQLAKKLNSGRQVRPAYFDEVLVKHMKLLEALEDTALGMMNDT